jgi:hypothetical protein
MYFIGVKVNHCHNAHWRFLSAISYTDLFFLLGVCRVKPDGLWLLLETLFNPFTGMQIYQATCGDQAKTGQHSRHPMAGIFRVLARFPGRWMKLD